MAVFKEHIDKAKQNLIEQGMELNRSIPVLLHEGFAAVGGGTGTLHQNTFEVAVDRGTVKYIDIFPQISGTGDQNAPFTLVAGGQTLLEDTNLARWQYNTQLGMDNRQRIRVNLNDAQTFTASLDLTNATSVQRVFVELYYTSPQYEYFLNNVFKLGSSLGLKQRTYRLATAIPAVGDISFLDFVLPRNSGNVIAVGVHSQSTVAGGLNSTNYNVAVNGIEIIKDVIGLNASTESGRSSYIMPTFIKAGSKVRVSSAKILASAINPVYYFTFFFDN